MDDTTTVELIWDEQTNTQPLDPDKNLLKSSKNPISIDETGSSGGR